MPRQSVPVMLDRDNLVWLRARTRMRNHGSLSETVDQVVAEARERTGRPAGPKRSVVGTITIAPPDRHLADADAAIRARFAASTDSARRLGERFRSTRAQGGRQVIERRG